MKIRERSGNIDKKGILTAFLYTLMRDEIPVGKLEKIIKDLEDNNVENVQYSNGWLTEYANDLEKRLTENIEDYLSEENVKYPNRTLRIDIPEGWLNLNVLSLADYSILVVELSTHHSFNTELPTGNWKVMKSGLNFVILENNDYDKN